MKLNAHQTALLGATGLSVVAWFAPVLDVLFRPILYLNTHIHELCHALAAVATGGSAEKIVVNADGSGMTPVLTNWFAVVASAGYVGAVVIGALLIAFGRDEKRARWMLGGLAGLLALGMLFWVRGDTFGVLWGFFWTFAIAAAAMWLRGKAAVFAAQFVGVQQCLHAFLSILTLLHLSVVNVGASDATLMEKATGGLVPAIVWAVLWGALGAGAVVLALRRAWK